METADVWKRLRSAQFHEEAEAIIRESRSDSVSIYPVRSAHYATYKVTTKDDQEWLVRIGAVGKLDECGPDNSGYLGTAAVSPTGQRREYGVALGFHISGSAVVVPDNHYVIGGYDVLWLPFLYGRQDGITAEQWGDSLTSLQAYSPKFELPVFTNRIKSMDRLTDLPDLLAKSLANQYDLYMEELFEIASSWSVIHGDVHSGNAILINRTVTLFDFDTACWAPSVWDWTHLFNRAGRGNDNGYTARELMDMSGYSQREIDAALKLRRTASLIAKASRENQKAEAESHGGN